MGNFKYVFEVGKLKHHGGYWLALVRVHFRQILPALALPTTFSIDFHAIEIHVLGFIRLEWSL